MKPAAWSLSYQVYLIPRLLGLFLISCKVIRHPAILSPPLLPISSSLTSSHSLSFSLSHTQPLSLFYPNPNLRLWLKLDWPAQGYINPQGCLYDAASPCLLFLEHLNLHSNRLKMVSTTVTSPLHAAVGSIYRGIPPALWINSTFWCKTKR